MLRINSFVARTSGSMRASAVGPNPQPHLSEAQRSHVHAVDAHAARLRLHQPVQRQQQAGLARARAPYDAHLPRTTRQARTASKSSERLARAGAHLRNSGPTHRHCVLTVTQRFESTVPRGEAVTWTVSYGGSSQVLSGTWWFSSAAGSMLSRFDGSGSSFSSDDGVWGAASGIVDGDTGYPSGFWGHGNGAAGDSGCAGVYRGSSSSFTASGLINRMFVVPSAAGTWRVQRLCVRPTQACVFARSHPPPSG